MTLYEKHGRRYVPANDTTALDGLNNGVWLVLVERGRRACRVRVDEPWDELTALQFGLEDAICEALSEHARMTDPRPSDAYGDWTTRPRPLGGKEKKAVEAFRAVMGEDCGLMMTRPSLREVAERAAKSVLERARKRREER